MPIFEEPEMKLNTQQEPVRLTGWTALIVGLALVGAWLWSTGADLRQIVGVLAITAITSIGGLEFARGKVSPYVPEPDGYVPEDL